MTVILDDVDLSTVQTSFTLDTKGVPFNRCAWLEIANESPQTLTINAGGLNMRVLAWERHPIELQRFNRFVWQAYNGADFPVSITPRLLAPGDSSYTNVMLATLYLTGEVPTSTTPQQLNRQSFVPNTITTQGNNGVSTALINTGNNPGTNIINVVPGDSASPTWTADNSGNFKIYCDDAGTLTLMLEIAAGAFPIVKLGSPGLFTTIEGKLAVNESFSSDADQIASNGTGLLFVAGLQFGGGPLILAQNPPVAQALASNGTITINGVWIEVTCSTNVTGIKMQAGTVTTQTVFLYNQGGGSLTFASSGSNVRQGSNVSVDNGQILTMIWDGSNWATSKS